MLDNLKMLPGATIILRVYLDFMENLYFSWGIFALPFPNMVDPGIIMQSVLSLLVLHCCFLTYQFLKFTSRKY